MLKSNKESDNWFVDYEQLKDIYWKLKDKHGHDFELAELDDIIIILNEMGYLK